MHSPLMHQCEKPRSSPQQTSVKFDQRVDLPTSSNGQRRAREYARSEISPSPLRCLRTVCLHWPKPRGVHLFVCLQQVGTLNYTAETLIIFPGSKTKLFDVKFQLVFRFDCLVIGKEISAFLRIKFEHVCWNVLRPKICFILNLLVLFLLWNSWCGYVLTMVVRFMTNFVKNTLTSNLFRYYIIFRMVYILFQLKNILFTFTIHFIELYYNFTSQFPMNILAMIPWEYAITFKCHDQIHLCTHRLFQYYLTQLSLHITYTNTSHDALSQHRAPIP